MKKHYCSDWYKISVLLCLLFCGCQTMAPYIVSKKDPFTGVKSSYMYVGESFNLQILSVLSGIPTRGLPSSWLFLSQSEGETRLNYVRLSPQMIYDVPDQANLLVKVGRSRSEKAEIISLPIQNSYHTAKGPLMVRAKIDSRTMQLLQEKEIDVVRIDKVSTNESDTLTHDWSIGPGYSKAFKQGAVKLLNPKEERRE